ncbi:FG-GAP repeat domain-containing protein [Desulfoluna butyratoxydans]|nr:VCBS repeat-containing protein [Desulfoluna butyratoxydans]
MACLTVFCVVAPNAAKGEEPDAAPISWDRFSDTIIPSCSRNLGRNLSPTAADLNGDGRAELYVGAYGKRVMALACSAMGGGASGVTANPLDAVTMSYESDTPCVALADIDNDGDNDAVWFDFRPMDNRMSSVYLNRMVFLKNQGSPVAPDFQIVSEEENPFAGISSEWQGTPAFGDFDGDGDADLIFGDRSGTFRYCRNLLVEEGGAVYAEMMGRLNPFFGIDVGDNSSPAVLDVDGDGDLDVVSGEIRGGLRWIENITASGGPLTFELREPSRCPFAALSVGIATMPAVLDLDGDTDLDIVVGSSQGRLAFLENPFLQPESPPLQVKSAAPKDHQENVDLSDALLALKTLGGALAKALDPKTGQGPGDGDGSQE